MTYNTQDIVLNVDHLDDDSACINFDYLDRENDEVINVGGYVHARIEQDGIVVCVYDADGNILSETTLSFAQAIGGLTV